MKGSDPLADPAPSADDPAPSKGGEAARPGGEEKPAAPKADGRASFANTRQHVADRAEDGDATGRFVNTKLNIALINDPKNGPRFTMTKREAGLKDDSATAKRREEGGEADREAKDDAAKIEPTELPSTSSDTAAPNPQSAEAKRDETPARQVEAAPPPAVQKARATAPTGVPPAAEPPAKVPVDSSKTFVGPNGTYYDESWRWMDWRGTKRSWNWPAALSFGHWFAYRRLYLPAGACLLFLAGVTAATVNDVPLLALMPLVLLMAGLAGVYGNILYFFKFRRAVDHVTEKGEGSYQELKGQLAASGGIDIRAAWIMGGATVCAIAAALGLTYHMRGGFAVNLWPF